MPRSENTGIRSVQIIKIEGSKFTFDYEAFKSIVDKNDRCKDLPVAVIIINGALRTGKSFFSNFIIRHLKSLEANASNPSNATQKVDEDYLTDYFVSRRGSDIQTLGVWALDEIFIYDNKAVVLMDTQGIFDQELNQAMTIALISLSTIVSSYQIYNLDKRIQEDHLCNMAYFSAYSSLISNTENTKLGQTLCLLVRDWPNFENNFDLSRCDAETDAYRKDFLENTKSIDKVKIDTRKKIHDTYDNVVVRLCPHPGHLVTEGKFSGRLSEVREDFMIHVEHIINQILKDLEPKRIGSNQALLCRELPNYLKEYVTLYENVKDALPEAMTILETTEKICQENAKTKTVHYYREKMMSRLRSRSMTKEDIEAWHKSCTREAQRYFNKLYIMGKDEDIKKIRDDIMRDIASEYQQCLLLAKEKNLFNIVYNGVTDLLRHLNLNVDFLSELFLKNSFLFMGVAYMFTVFLPFGGEFIASIIRYVVCMLAGMYLCIYLKEQKNSEAVVSTGLHDFKGARSSPGSKLEKSTTRA
ncbi:atlastin-2-like [Yasminevirus sp. GU-2018]|uniref:Atlastin-2-like n=1 Tax=Yasminevirus sp. GU-2018 TaxID=2420051 RepID=A0A5K0U7I4_9VIRU|nr:atlastin-2-like [Yasminevirus sp. GU-2018]